MRCPESITRNIYFYIKLHNLGILEELKKSRPFLDTCQGISE